MSGSSKRVCLGFIQSEKTLPSTEKKELVTAFIDTFRRSIVEDDRVSHSESKV